MPLPLILPSLLMEVANSSNCHNLSPPSNATTANSSPPVDYDLVVILAAMICALVCALGLNSMLQCIVRCTRRTLTQPAVWVASRRLNTGIKREHIASLPVTTFSSTSTEEKMSEEQPLGCPICLSDFSEGDKIRVLTACKHRFHVGCIDTWLLSHPSCPTCRNRLRAEAPLEIVTTS